MTRILNDGVIGYQENTRTDTQNKVEKVIVDLLNEGYDRTSITISIIKERTGFCRTTLGKKHVLKIYKEYGVCRYKDTKQVKPDDLKEYIQYMEKELKEYKTENTKVKAELDIQIKKNLKLEESLALKEDEILTLRGQLLVLYQQLSNRDIKVDL